MIAHVLAAMVVAQWKTEGTSRLEAAEPAADSLANRLQGFETCGRPGSVNPDAFGRAMIHGNEDGNLAILEGHRAWSCPTSDPGSR